MSLARERVIQQQIVFQSPFDETTKVIVLNADARQWSFTKRLNGSAQLIRLLPSRGEECVNAQTAGRHQSAIG